jgi:hypothetical protein
MRQSITDEYGEQLLLHASPRVDAYFPMEHESSDGTCFTTGEEWPCSTRVGWPDGRLGKKKAAWPCSATGKIFAADAYLFLWNLHHTDDAFEAEVLVELKSQCQSVVRRSGPVGFGVFPHLRRQRGIVTGTALGLQRQPDSRRDAAQALWISASERSYSAACSSGATRGRMIWIRVPPPGSESRSSRPPRRLVTML